MRRAGFRWLLCGFEGAEAEGGSVGSFGAPPADGCAWSKLDVTRNDTDAKSKDRAGRLCWRMGKTSGLLGPGFFDAEKVIRVQVVRQK